MPGRRWFRKDVLLPIVYLLAFGPGLYLLRRELFRIPSLAESEFVRLALAILLFIYLLLILITVRHVLSSYDLERYDPGDPASLKRLLRRHRYRLPRNPMDEEKILIDFERALFQSKYQLEAESHLIGRIYRRRHAIRWPGRPGYDRVIIQQHQPLNIMLVDQLLQDCIRYLESEAEKPSRRNILLLATRMDDTGEVASAAAGVVNFLGKFEGGSLCPMLLAVKQHRLFYPADRTLLPRSHRLLQDRLRLRLVQVIMKTMGGRDEATSESAERDMRGLNKDSHGADAAAEASTGNIGSTGNTGSIGDTGSTGETGSTSETT